MSTARAGVRRRGLLRTLCCTRCSGILLLAVLLVILSCDSFDGRPDEARVELDGPAGARVQLVISVKFVAAMTETGVTRVVVLESDTLSATLPYRAAWQIRGDYRFLAETSRLDSDVSGLRMRVLIDDRSQFDRTGALLPEKPYRFVYTFNQRIAPNVEIVF